MFNMPVLGDSPSWAEACLWCSWAGWSACSHTSLPLACGHRPSFAVQEAGHE
jgi:hypothetical protein